MARRITLLTLVALAAVSMLAGPAAADHIGNNKTDLTGAGDVTGQAVANYSTGSDVINAVAQVRNLPAGEYVFQLRHNAGATFEVCTFTSDENGSAGCSGSIDGVGFHHADILSAGGGTVATGRFDRRGNCRDAGQSGSQCQANDARNGSMPQ